MSRIVIFGARSARRRDALRDVPRASRDIEMAEQRLPRRFDHRDEDILPHPVKAARHDIVHEIVALGHLVEHVVDQTLLLVECHIGIAEMRQLG